jgi:hypothetical protein
MWQRMAILVGGYGFIVLSYAWVWALTFATVRYLSPKSPERPAKADVRFVLDMMAAWTVIWAVLMVVKSVG